ncbi:hypothetical protein FB45DRAFT_481964 [Roridomyces roridus]|uniref:Uncharacterized protein n=1 Tax=Roridomyces roridus TaxID=1738132 RepID=A0AAD7BZZ5_9AGAR|nr:hypothetical protein FB45DRAFT_481964 [Roridomyces roridus]
MIPGILGPHVFEAFAAGPAAIPGVPVGASFAQGPTFTAVVPGAVTPSQVTPASTGTTTTTTTSSTSTSTSTNAPQAASPTISQSASSTPDTDSSPISRGTESAQSTQTSSSGSAHITTIPEASASVAGLDLCASLHLLLSPRWPNEFRIQVFSCRRYHFLYPIRLCHHRL